MLDIKPRETFEVRWIVRVDKKMDNDIKMLARKHKVPKSTVVRSLIEEGLRHIK